MLNIFLGSKSTQADSRILEASVERVGDVAVIRPNGRVSIDGGDTGLRDLVVAALDRGYRRILLNLSGVSFIDSSGIGELVAAYSTAKQRGAVVRVCCLSERVFSLFQTVALLQVFDVREDEKDGLAAFGAGASR